MVDSTELARPDALYLDWTFTPAPRVRPIVAPLVSPLDFLTTCYDPRLSLTSSFMLLLDILLVCACLRCYLLSGYTRLDTTVEDCRLPCIAVILPS
jgi:hypothetical protein